ncbi:uncharacterized protein LOC134708342 [Mytilus trossulus]|uniref:uncharacterized protein LOC134682949 n=2 Tax=Mytilus trossulus TaxID=6551 RepID=UPI0030053333
MLSEDLQESETEEPPDLHSSLPELKLWKVTKLQEWLEKHKLKKSGLKEVLVNRVYRAMSGYMDSDPDSSDENLGEDLIPVHEISNWKTLDFSDIPNGLASKDVDGYFLYQKNPTTGARLHFDRQMKKAKRLCNEGFIRDILYSDLSDFCYIKSKCLPSMKQSVSIGTSGMTAKFYSLNVCLGRKFGNIFNARCNCKAGGAGLCAHVGALLYTLVKTKDSCTSSECTWDRPRPLQRKPSPARVCDITFTKTEKETQTKKVRPYPGIYQAGPIKEIQNETFLDDILKGLENAYPQCVLYQTLRFENANIDPFLELFYPDYMFCDFVSLTRDTCVKDFTHFFDNLKVTDAISQTLEEGTRGQSVNTNWIKARKNLITASVMGEVYKRKKLVPDNLLKKICGYVTVPDRVKSIKYGRKYESVAVSQYIQKHTKECGNTTVESRGLLVNPKYPFLGASIDSLVTCNKCGVGLVEVKCPYGSDSKKEPWRNKTPIECAKDTNFCCNEVDGQLELKDTSNYMYQVQGQLGVYELNWVDFVIWTKKGISVERINFDESTWNSMLQKLKEFYIGCVIPEIFTRRVERGKPLY